MKSFAKGLTVNYTTTHNLCMGCGICVGSCCLGAIKMEEKSGNYRPVIDPNKCVNCGKCIKSCAGVGIDFKAYNEKLFPNALHTVGTAGSYEACYVGHSTQEDIRFHSASGGMITQFLIWLLEQKKIDGAIVTKFDKSYPYLFKTFIATTTEEIISARSSIYAPVQMGEAINELLQSNYNKIVIVGIPCHIQSIRKLMQINKKMAQKIVGLFSLYCSSGRSFYMTEYLLGKNSIDKYGINYFQFRDEGCLGSIVIKHKDKNSLKDKVYQERYQDYYHSLRSFFIPKRCLLCIDHYGEFSDISFGDIHLPPYSKDKIGVNSIMVRNRYWNDLLIECMHAGAISINKIDFEMISKSQKMSFKKKGRNVKFITINKMLGKRVPDYNIACATQLQIKDILNYLQNRCQQFIGNHKYLWKLIGILKKDTSSLK